MMDWRTWAFDRARLDAGILTDVSASAIYGAGGLIAAPRVRPFVALRFGAETPELSDGDRPSATSTRLTVYVHDDPGDYLRIARILGNVRSVFAGNATGMTGGGIMGVWEGDSGDLSDDLYGTIMKYGEFRLVGKVA